MNEWFPEDHLAYFIMDVVKELNLQEIYDEYEGSEGGKPTYDPRMMKGLLLLVYSIRVFSSRKIEKATYEWVPFRVISGDQHPDHDTVAYF